MKDFFVILTSSLFLVSCGHPTPEQAETEPHAGSSLISMEREAQRNVGLQVAPASAVHLTERLQVTGTVQPVDSRIGEVRPLARGRVMQVLVAVGDRVARGQPLLRFDNIESGELFAQYHVARAELERLRVQHAAASRQSERNRSLAVIGAVPKKDAELNEAEVEALLRSIKAQEGVLAGITSRLQRFGLTMRENETLDPSKGSSTTIDSPFSGVILAVRAAPGEAFEAGAGLLTIADLSRVWVQAEVYEKDLARVQVGGTASITVDTYPGELFSGKVAYVSDMLDPKTRTAKVRCEVANPRARLKLDMFAAVELPTTFDKEAIVVPASAVQQIDGKDTVFIRTTATQFEAREVEIGRSVDGRVEVVRGLASGEAVVAQGGFHLKSIVLGKQLGEKE